MHKSTIVINKSNINKKKKLVERVSIICIITNFILLILKCVIGVISNSQAMIADSLHSFEDMVSSIISLIGIKISTQKVDSKHPYGYGKAEYIFSMIISMLMIVASISMVKSSICNIITLNKMNFSIGVIIVCIVNILLKTMLYIYTSIQYKKTKNILIRTSKEDQRNDIIITFSILISSIFSIFNIYLVDYILGLIISFWIGVVGIKIFRVSYNILIDTNISEDRIEQIKNKVLLFDVVESVDKIIGKPIGDKYVIILKISMQKNMDIYNSHDMQSKIKKTLLMLEYVQDVVIHVNPY